MTKSEIEENQRKLNEENQKFYELLPEADKKKFDAIGKCFAILKEADVMAYIFADLPDPGNLQTVVYQYNNVGELSIFEGEKATKASKDRAAVFQYSLYGAVFNLLAQDLATRNYAREIISPELIGNFFLSSTHAYTRYRFFGDPLFTE